MAVTSSSQTDDKWLRATGTEVPRTTQKDEWCRSGEISASSSSRPSHGHSVLQRIQEEFVKSLNSAANTDYITAKDLARRWHRLAEDEQWSKGCGPLSEQDKRIIALRVAQLMHDMGLRREGRVTREEWVHHLLMTESGCAAAQVNSLLKVAIRKQPRILQELQQMFVTADTTKSGSLSFKQIVEMYSHKLWHVRAGKDGRPLSDAELAAGNPEDFAREIIQAMDVSGNERVTYAEFMAYCLGRRKEEVTINLYDLSNGIAQSASQYILGVHIEGVWHTGVVAFGREYFFSRDTVYDTPGETSFGTPLKTISMGHTLWRQEELHSHIVEDLKPIYHRDTYDAIDCNCNHFSASVLDFLNCAALPEEVTRQPEFLKNATWVRAIRPIMNWYMRDGIVARDQDSSKGVETPAELQRRLAAESPLLVPGSLVKIEPTRGVGSVLGIVCTPEGRPESCLDSRTVNNNTVREGAVSATTLFSCGCRCSDLAAPVRRVEVIALEAQVCVRYFKLALSDPAERSPGKLVTEMVARSRLTPAKLEEINGDKVFSMALHATMSNSMPASYPTGAPCKVKEPMAVCVKLEALLPSSPTNVVVRPVEAKKAEERAMEELTAIGFEANQAEAALDSTDWRVDAAVALLLDEKGLPEGKITRSPPSQSGI